MRFEHDFPPADDGVRSGVRHYTLLEADVGMQTIARAASVRPQQFLQIVLEGVHRLRNVETGQLVRLGRATLIGLCTYRKYDLLISGRLRVFYVHFQPGALHAWTGLDMGALTDGCLDAREAFGPEIDALSDRLATAAARQRRAVADSFFARYGTPAPTGVAALARAMRDGNAAAAAPGWVDELSVRQLQRRFARQIGVTPKLFARLCRLAAVIERREREPDLSWTDLAHDGGYADQAHLTRDFRAFVRAAPSRFQSVAAADG